MAINDLQVFQRMSTNGVRSPRVNSSKKPDSDLASVSAIAEVVRFLDYFEMCLQQWFEEFNCDRIFSKCDRQSHKKNRCVKVPRLLDAENLQPFILTKVLGASNLVEYISKNNTKAYSKVFSIPPENGEIQI